MTRTSVIIAVGSALFLTVATLSGMAVAQGPGGSGGPGGHGHSFERGGGGTGPAWLQPERMMDRIFDRLDRNFDSVIDQAEFKSVIENRFDRIDRMKKGVITGTDLKARMQADGSGRSAGGRNPEAFAERFVARFMESFGKPADGQVTKTEFLDAYLDVFKYINRAGDGRITRKEVEQYFNVARRMAPALRG